MRLDLYYDRGISDFRCKNCDSPIEDMGLYLRIDWRRMTTKKDSPAKVEYEYSPENRLEHSGILRCGCGLESRVILRREYTYRLTIEESAINKGE